MRTLFVCAMCSSFSKSVIALRPRMMTCASQSRTKFTERPSNERTTTFGISVVTSLSILTRSIKNRRCSPYDIKMAIGYRVKRTRINCSPHTVCSLHAVKSVTKTSPILYIKAPGINICEKFKSVNRDTVRFSELFIRFTFALRFTGDCKSIMHCLL